MSKRRSGGCSVGGDKFDNVIKDNRTMKTEDESSGLSIRLPNNPGQDCSWDHVLHQSSTCLHCDKSVALKCPTISCPVCLRVKYCSRDCLMEDRQNHKEECSIGERAPILCGFCGRVDRHPLRCPLCSSVAYCTDTCLSLDQKNHLPACIAIRNRILEMGSSVMKMTALSVRSQDRLAVPILAQTFDVPKVMIVRDFKHLLKTIADTSETHCTLLDTSEGLARSAVIIDLLKSGITATSVLRFLYYPKLNEDDRPSLERALNTVQNERNNPTMDEKTALSITEIKEKWRNAIDGSSEIVDKTLNSKIYQNSIQRYLQKPCFSEETRGELERFFKETLITGPVVNVTFLKYRIDGSPEFSPQLPTSLFRDWDAKEVMVLKKGGKVVDTWLEHIENCLEEFRKKHGWSRVHLQLLDKWPPKPFEFGDHTYDVIECAGLCDEVSTPEVIKIFGPHLKYGGRLCTHHRRWQRQINKGDFFPIQGVGAAPCHALCNFAVRNAVTYGETFRQYLLAELVTRKSTVHRIPTFKRLSEGQLLVLHPYAIEENIHFPFRIRLKGREANDLDPFLLNCEWVKTRERRSLEPSLSNDEPSSLEDDPFQTKKLRKAFPGSTSFRDEDPLAYPKVFVDDMSYEGSPSRRRGSDFRSFRISPKPSPMPRKVFNRVSHHSTKESLNMPPRPTAPKPPGRSGASRASRSFERFKRKSIDQILKHELAYFADVGPDVDYIEWESPEPGNSSYKRPTNLDLIDPKQITQQSYTSRLEIVVSPVMDENLHPPNRAWSDYYQTRLQMLKRDDTSSNGASQWSSSPSPPDPNNHSFWQSANTLDNLGWSEEDSDYCSPPIDFDSSPLNSALNSSFSSSLATIEIVNRPSCSQLALASTSEQFRKKLQAIGNFLPPKSKEEIRSASERLFPPKNGPRRPPPPLTFKSSTAPIHSSKVCYMSSKPTQV